MTRMDRSPSRDRAGALCGRVEVSEHVLFVAQDGDDWTVVVNGVVVDQLISRFAALERIRHLAQAIRAGGLQSAKTSRAPSRREETPRFPTAVTAAMRS